MQFQNGKKSPTIICRPRMAARRTPACLDLARRKLRFRGVCTAASRKMERLDATVQGDRCSVFGGLFGLKFEQLKIGSSVVRFILRKSKTLLQELGHAISIQKDVRNQPDYWAIEPSFQPPPPSALFVTARGESISCMKQATVITLLCSLSLLRGNRTSTIGKEQ